MKREIIFREGEYDADSIDLAKLGVLLALEGLQIEERFVPGQGYALKLVKILKEEQKLKSTK